VEATNRAVLDTIAHDVFAPAVVEEAWRWPSLRFAIAQRAIPDERRTRETELARVEAELDRLIGAIAAGGVLDAVRAREGRSRELSRRLAALEGREIRALAW
jgi:hypothetical protein